MSISANPSAGSIPAAVPFGFVAPPPATIDVHGTVSTPNSESFVDRRAAPADAGNSERRQFGSSHSELSPDARELATAIDRYKIENRRRYITCEEMLAVVKTLGYHRD